VHFRRGEGIKLGVEGRVNGDELALEVRAQFGDGDAVFGGNTFEFVGGILAVCDLFQVDETGVPRWDLNAFVA
jgi:hypothetical protein